MPTVMCLQTLGDINNCSTEMTCRCDFLTLMELNALFKLVIEEEVLCVYITVLEISSSFFLSQKENLTKHGFSSQPGNG